MENAKYKLTEYRINHYIWREKLWTNKRGTYHKFRDTGVKLDFYKYGYWFKTLTASI